MHIPIKYDDIHRRNSPVTLGSTVVLRDLDTNELETYTLVRPDEVDILRNRISSFSPLGLALGRRRTGEIVEVDAPGGWVHLEIASIFDACEPALSGELCDASGA
jgi:transcription elongation GreA/GreB family factor